MATVAGIKLPKKAPKCDPMFADEKYTGAEPVWDHDRALEMGDEEFNYHMSAAFRYYNYYFNQKDLHKDVVSWLQANSKFTKEQLTAFIRSEPNAMPMTACSLTRMMLRGMPMKEKAKAFVISAALKAIGGGISEKVAKAEAKVATAKAFVPTIQDRLNEKTAETIGEMEGQVDLVFKGKPMTLKTYDYLTTRNIAQAQVGKIRAVFQRQADEIAELVAGKDDQLKEGYSHLKKADIKRITEFYTVLLADIDSYTQVKKATKKARKPRAVSKDKVVAKLNFLKESKELKLVSINPLDVLNASVLWVYNTKTRKLGRYQADSHSGTLGIKGTSIAGFDETKSVAKTLRKPDEQLKELMKTGKVGLRTFLKDIKAVETRLNGRISAEILLLKIE